MVTALKKRSSIRTRLTLALVAIGLFGLCLTLFSQSLLQLHDDTESWRRRFTSIELQTKEIANLVLRLVATNAPDENERLKEDVASRIGDIERDYLWLDKLANSMLLTTTTKRELIRSASVTNEYWKTEVLPILTTLNNPKLTTAQKQIVAEALETPLNQYASIADVAVSISEEVIETILSLVKWIMRIAISISGIGFVIAVIFIQRTIKRIEHISQTAETISEGTWSLRATEEGLDEISSLGHSFNKMTGKLLNEKRYAENIVNRMGDMLVVTDETGTIFTANHALERNAGYDEGSLKGKHISTLLLGTQEFQHYFASLKKQSPTQESPTQSEILDIHIKRKDDSSFPAKVTGSTLLTSYGSHHGIILLFRDMTAQARLEKERDKLIEAQATVRAEAAKAQELAELNQQLKDSKAQAIEAGKFAALGEMASGIAHEINNPLAIIHGRASQLRDLVTDDNMNPQDILKIAERIEVTAMRAARIIRSLRSFAHDARNEPTESVPIQTIFDETLDLCKEKFKSHGIAIIESPRPAVSIDCRSFQIAQVLLNLLNNAHDAIETLDEKWIKLDVSDENKDVTISVTDSGSGIPAEVVAKMMQPFFTTKPVGKGTGLGLSISRGIIEAHHGELRIDQTCANTRFVIRLPKQQPAVVELKESA